MGSRFLSAFFPAVLAAALTPQVAHADIYTWVDASGAINVSNVAPPDGIRVASVTHASAPSAARADAAREATRQAEVQALAERVRQLEYEAELAQRPVPPQVEYRAVAPPPPVIQYVVMPPPPQYAANPAPPAYTGCDPLSIDCGFWGTSGFYPGFYPTTFVVLRAPNFHRFNHGRGGGHPMMAQPPMHPPGPCAGLKTPGQDPEAPCRSSAITLWGSLIPQCKPPDGQSIEPSAT
jgi:hypothetical protein